MYKLWGIVTFPSVTDVDVNLPIPIVNGSAYATPNIVAAYGIGVERLNNMSIRLHMQNPTSTLLSAYWLVIGI